MKNVLLAGSGVAENRELTPTEKTTSPMKHGTADKRTSRWLTSLALLALVFSIQLYPFYHLHHFHEDGSLGFELSAHPLEVELAHESDHNHDHHEGDDPHGDGHQDRYNKHLEWRIDRPQTSRTPIFDDQHFFSSIHFDLAKDRQAVHVDCEELPSANKYLTRYLMFRGPPVLG